MNQIRYTTAEESYDYNSIVVTSRPTDYTDDRGRPFRMVELTEDGCEYQCGRYGSGMHRAYTEEEFADEIGWGYYVKRV